MHQLQSRVPYRAASAHQSTPFQPRQHVGHGGAIDPDLIRHRRLIDVTGDRLRGEVRATLGPIETVFAGDGTTVFDDTEHRAEISGMGRDNRTGTRLNARAVVTLRALDEGATSAALSIDYTLRGPLAQFARPSVVREFAAEITDLVARNLEARLRGTVPAPVVRLSAGGLMLRAIWRRLRAMIGLG